MKNILSAYRIAIPICTALALAPSAFADDSKKSAAPAPVLVPQLVNTLDPQTQLRFSPDESLAISMHREQLHLWDLKTGTLLRVLAQPGVAHYRDTRFESSSRRLLSINYDFTIQEWNIETGTNTTVMPSRRYGGPGIALAENTSRVFWLEFDGYLRTSNLIATKTQEGALIAEKPRAFGGKGPEGTTDALIQKPLPEATLYDISISADGKKGLVQRGAALPSLEIYKLDQGSLQCKIEAPKSGASKAPRRYTLFPDGKRIFSTAFLEAPILFSADQCKPIAELPFKTEHVRMVSITGDGRKALLADSKNTKVIDIDSKKILFELPNTSDISDVTISKSGRRGLLSGPNRFELWDLTTGTLERSLSEGKANISPVQALAFSQAGGRIIASSFAVQNPILSIWDFQTLGLIGTTTLDAGMSARLNLAADGTRAWSVGGAPRKLAHWDLSPLISARAEAFTPNAKAPLSSKIFEQGINDSEIAVNTSAELALTLDTHINRPSGGGPASLSRDLILWKGASPKTITTLGINERHRPLALSPDGRLAAIARFDAASQCEHIHIWNTSTGTQITTIKFDSMYIWSGAFAPDSKTLAAADITPGSFGESRIRLYDAENGKLISTLKGGFSAAYALSFSADQKTLAAGYGDRFARLFNTETGALLSSKTLTGHDKYIRSTAFSKDGRYLFTGSDDGVMRIHRLDQLSQPTSAVLISSGADWLIYTDDGYFDASRRGGSLVAATSGLNPYRIDQFAIQKNRPDIILQRLGLGTPALIEHYRRRYERRLQKLGIRAAGEDFSFEHAPKAKITQLENQNKEATLHFELNAQGQELYRYNLFVNDVPLFGALGKPISGRTATLTEKFELSAGKNKIEVSALDAEGNESLRDYRIVWHKSPAKSDLYYLGFGVSRYKNPAYNLGYPHKDILDLGDVLKAGQGIFQNVHIATHINEQVTVDAVRRAKELLKGAKVDDTVIVFIAGHGLREPGPLGDYYFATHEADTKRLPDTAANFELVEDILAGIKPRKKLLLMDTCESGEEEEESVSNSNELPLNTAGSRGLRPRTTRALVLENQQSKKQSNKKLFISDRNRYVYNDLSRRTGAIVLSSSLGRELSWELDELQNGVFTEELLLALTTKAADTNADNSLSMDELRDYITSAVPKRTGQKQHPVVDRDNLEIDFSLPLIPEASAVVTRADPALRQDLSPNLLASRSLKSGSGAQAGQAPETAPPQTPLPRACGCRIPSDSQGNTAGLISAFIASIVYRIRRRSR